MYDFVELYGNNSQNYPQIPHLSGAEPVVDLWEHQDWSKCLSPCTNSDWPNYAISKAWTLSKLDI